MSTSTAAVNLIRSGALQRGLDPNAVLAVARMEGLGGGVGDNGTSFGPWQLHLGGAFPTGVVPHGQEQQWAWSPQGINYALDHMATVAKGLRGSQAIQALVTHFERPANPSREIAGASRAYGLPSSAGYTGNAFVGPPGVSPGVSAVSASAARSGLSQQAIQALMALVMAPANPVAPTPVGAPALSVPAAVTAAPMVAPQGGGLQIAPQGLFK